MVRTSTRCSSTSIPRHAIPHRTVPHRAASHLYHHTTQQHLSSAHPTHYTTPQVQTISVTRGGAAVSAVSNLTRATEVLTRVDVGDALAQAKRVWIDGGADWATLHGDCGVCAAPWRAGKLSLRDELKATTEQDGKVPNDYGCCVNLTGQR